MPEQKLFEVRFLNLDYLFNQIYEFFRQFYDFFIYVTGGANNGSGVPPESIQSFFYTLKIFLSLASVFFIIIIVYSLVRIYEIRRAEKKALESAAPFESEPTPQNDRWQVVLDHVNSANPAEWRLAILEADNMLDEMVRRMGYQGKDLGERLKTVEPSDFSNIQSAWEAHKVRNKIAHEGSEFFLSQHEARRIVGLYEDVFKEFKFI
ncbi:MAG: hypothetical protein AAB355_01915 [Patescibacteria group bacterium]